MRHRRDVVDVRPVIDVASIVFGDRLLEQVQGNQQNRLVRNRSGFAECRQRREPCGSVTSDDDCDGDSCVHRDDRDHVIAGSGDACGGVLLEVMSAPEWGQNEPTNFWLHSKLRVPDVFQLTHGEDDASYWPH